MNNNMNTSLEKQPHHESSNKLQYLLWIVSVTGTVIVLLFGKSTYQHFFKRETLEERFNRAVIVSETTTWVLDESEWPDEK